MGFVSSIRSWFSGQKPLERPIVPLPYQRPTLDEHLAPGSRKRILALDGGGVRGTMSVAVLERIEAILREAHGGHPDFRLCDYFDLIGGTSTGSIIAGGLAARRYSASDIKDFYFDLGPKVFRGSLFRQGFSRAKFDAKRLLKELKGVFGDIELGSPEIATGLGVVTKRVDTDSTWVLHNNPQGMFFDTPDDASHVGNRYYPLRNVIRASTAAPHFFRPEKIEIIAGKENGLFVDGAMSPHNNPAFQMLMLAGMDGYGFRWDLTPDNMLMISVGTGSSAQTRRLPKRQMTPQIVRTIGSLKAIITSNEDFIELLMQWVAECKDPKQIDMVVGDLCDEYLAGKPLLKYQRYQSYLTKESLYQDFGLTLTDKQVETLRKMEDPKCLPIAYDVGLAMAETLVKPAHFPEAFNLRSLNE